MSESKQILEKNFPNGYISMIDQFGNELTEGQTGTTLTLWAREGLPPHSAEIFDAETGGERHYAEMGLEFEGKTLVGYDGVFELPRELIETVKELGYSVEL